MNNTTHNSSSDVSVSDVAMSTVAGTSLHVGDIAVIIAYFIFVLAVGLWVRCFHLFLYYVFFINLIYTFYANLNDILNTG